MQLQLSEQEQNRVMRSVQHAVPLVHDPFAELGRETEVPEQQVLALLQLWEAEDKLREISAILEGSALGYESALVAGKVEERDIERVTEIVNAHPTVTHNYLRDHAYNLWYTIAVPHEMGLDATLAALSKLIGVRFHALRRTATFKIGVNFDLETRQNRTAAASLETVAPVQVGTHEARLFRTLQTPLPLVERPFIELARRHEVDADELLAFGRRHLGGAMRRYVGTLRHRKLGVRANAMIVWNAPDGKTEELGQSLAQAPEVSHCYARNTIEGFPYTLYSMIHGPDLEACQQVAGRLAAELGVDDYRLLVSLEEFKKTRLRYFLPELDEWWAAHGGS